MTKQDLEPGMVVVLRNGLAYMYLKASKDILLRERGYMPLDDYNFSLYIHNSKRPSKWDIVKVYKGCYESIFCINLAFTIKEALKKEPIWSRPSYTELTMQQIADKFNIPVESLRIKE